MSNRTLMGNLLSMLGSHMICILVVFLLSRLFFTTLLLSAPIAIIGGGILGHDVRRWMLSRQKTHEQLQFKWLLEHLISSLSAGATLEHALIRAPDSLSLLLPSQAPLMKGLRSLQVKLGAHQPVDSLLASWSKWLPTTESRIFVKVLPIIQKTGGDLCRFVRMQHQVYSDILSLKQDMTAETTQRRTEAVILVMMPPAMTLLIQGSGFSGQADQPTSLFLSIGMALAFLMFISSAVLVLKAFTALDKVVPNKTTNDRTPVFLKKYLGPLSPIVNKCYRRLLPDPYYSRLVQIIHTRAVRTHSDTKQKLNEYFMIKAQLMALSLLPTMALAASDLRLSVLLAIVPVLTAFVHDQVCIREAVSGQLSDQLEYPAFLNLCSNLLTAGISLHGTMMTVLQVKPAGHSDFARDLAAFEQQINVGRTVEQSLEMMARDCPVHQVQSALLMMVRYSREGRPENLQILKAQSFACWSLQRRAMRKKLEQASLALLIPMAFDLLAVMMVVMLPAMVTIQAV